MAEGDGAAVGIYVAARRRKCLVSAEDGESLRGEGFVELDEI